MRTPLAVPLRQLGILDIEQKATHAAGAALSSGLEPGLLTTLSCVRHYHHSLA
jgi:hypothetical protein